MRRIATAIIASSFALAALPAAASERLSDRAYIAAVACQGALGEAANDSLKTLVKQQRAGRDVYVLDQAKDARRAAQRQARNGGSTDPKCARYAQSSGGAVASGSTTTTAR